MNNNENANDGSHKSGFLNFIKNPWNIVGAVLCIILIPILLINCILIVKGMFSPNEVPSIGNYSPFIVLTDSMEPEINAGDLIICKKIDDAKSLEVGMTISFFDPAGNGSTVVTHKITNVYTDEETGKLYFRTRGVANNIEDRYPVPEENIIGVYKGTRFPVIGYVVVFAQKPIGLIVCIGVPVLLFAIYWFLRKRADDKRNRKEIENLKAENAAAKENAALSQIEALKLEIEALKKKQSDSVAGDDENYSATPSVGTSDDSDNT